MEPEAPEAGDDIILIQPIQLDRGWVAIDAAGSPVVAGLLSLVVPGLGQFWIGQRWRGIRLFISSFSVCFGLGLVNVVVARDAYRLAVINEWEPLSPRRSTRLLVFLEVVWDVAVGSKDWFVRRLKPGKMWG